MSDPLNFSVELVTTENNKGQTETAAKAPDNRSLAARMFTIHDPKTGEVSPMPVRAYNCATSTVSDQGYKAWDLANQIPVYLGYKAAVPDFKGPTKGRDFVTVGKRPGRPNQGGNPGLMLDIAELPEFIEHLQQIQASLTPEVVNQLRQANGLPRHPTPAAEVPPTEEG